MVIPLLGGMGSDDGRSVLVLIYGKIYRGGAQANNVDKILIIFTFFAYFLKQNYAYVDINVYIK